MKIKVLLQNSKKLDRRIWLELPTTEIEVEEAIEDISVDTDNEYIICNYKSDTDINFYISLNTDVFEINKKLQNINTYL